MYIRPVTNLNAYTYICVCLVTNVVHLKLVSSLSTEAFLVSLTRFMFQQRPRSHIFSCTKLIVIANRVLQTNFNKLSQTQEVTAFLSEESIQLHFIPPSAPHFGGLWEAAMKSAKQHNIENGCKH